MVQKQVNPELFERAREIVLKNGYEVLHIEFADVYMVNKLAIQCFTASGSDNHIYDFWVLFTADPDHECLYIRESGECGDNYAKCVCHFIGEMVLNGKLTIN